MAQLTWTIEYMCLIYSCFEIYGFLEYEYVGCFVDQPNRTLPLFELKYDSTMTNEKCALLCCSYSSTITFFGTEAYDACYCGNQSDTSHFVLASWTQCSMACTGDHTQVCGGSWRLSIYRIDCTSSLTSKDQGTTALDCELPGTTNDRNTAALTTATTQNVQELDSTIRKIVNDLKINKTNTSSYWNRKRSAADNRISSLAIGVVGIIVIVTPTVLIIIGDLSKCLFCKKGKRENSVCTS